MESNIDVLVHPFDCDIYEDQPQYTLARENKIKGAGDLVVFTCNPEKIKGILGDRPATIITAEDYSARPLEGWDNYNSLIQNYKEIIISGAELRLDSKGFPVNGCVLHAYEETNHPNKRIEIASCWIDSSRNN